MRAPAVLHQTPNLRDLSRQSARAVAGSAEAGRGAPRSEDEGIFVAVGPAAGGVWGAPGVVPCGAGLATAHARSVTRACLHVSARAFVCVCVYARM